MPTRREFLQQATAAGIAVAVPSAASRATTPSEHSVNTVLGPIDASKLGFTLPHEHICPSSAGFWQAWPEFFGGRANFVQKVVDRLKAARDGGVNTIVDVTPFDIGRNIRLLEEVSRKSGMQIVACTGHWLIPSLSMSARTTEEITDFFMLEIGRGIEDTGIKPGVIKVATDRDGVTPFIEKALRAAARASKATGIPVTTHTLASDRSGEKQAKVFESEGLDPAKVCVGHCDDTNDMEYLTGLVKRGYTIGMDHITWGIGADTKVLSWQQRAECIKQLVDLGYANRIFLSHDWYYGISMAPSGVTTEMEARNPDGILFNTRQTIPYLKQIGVTDDQVRQMTVENPRRFFGA